MSEPLDFGIVLALAYAGFVDEMRAGLDDDLHRSFGYVARAVADAPLTLGELAARLGMTPPGALKIVDEMEASGHLERTPDPRDARVKRLRLTAKGKSALAAARRFHAQFEARLAKRVGKAKAAACREVLEAIIEARTLQGAPPPLRPM